MKSLEKDKILVGLFIIILGVLFLVTINLNAGQIDILKQTYDNQNIKINEFYNIINENYDIDMDNLDLTSEEIRVIKEYQSKTLNMAELIHAPSYYKVDYLGDTFTIGHHRHDMELIKEVFGINYNPIELSSLDEAFDQIILGDVDIITGTLHEPGIENLVGFTEPVTVIPKYLYSNDGILFSDILRLPVEERVIAMSSEYLEITDEVLKQPSSHSSPQLKSVAFHSCLTFMSVMA